MLHSNNGGEFVKVHRFCSQSGIVSQYSCPYTSAQNGRAERKHRHVVEINLTLLAQASMHLNFWWDAFLTSTTLINGLPTDVLVGKSPMQLLLKKDLDLKSLKIFGCACYPTYVLSISY